MRNFSVTHGGWWKLLITHRLWKWVWLLHTFPRMKWTIHSPGSNILQLLSFFSPAWQMTAAGLTACRMRLYFRLYFMKPNCFKIIDSKSGNADRLLQDFCYDLLSHMSSSLPSLWKITYLKYFLFIFWHAFGVLCQRAVTSLLDIILVSLSTTICVVRHIKKTTLKSNKNKRVLTHLTWENRKKCKQVYISRHCNDEILERFVFVWLYVTPCLHVTQQECRKICFLKTFPLKQLYKWSWLAFFLKHSLYTVVSPLCLFQLVIQREKRPSDN